MNLLFGTSLYDLKQADMPPAPDVTGYLPGKLASPDGGPGT